MSRTTKGAADAERPGDDTLSRVELQLALLLRRAERTGAVRAGHTPALERSGYLLLLVLGTEGPLGINALAERQGLDASTVTRQVVSLEKAGFARRGRDPQDGRAVRVEATAAGRRQLEYERVRRAALYDQVLADWSPVERATLASLLERLNQDLDAFRREPEGR
ncbi:MarR family winged helix-turn-helix transcriptional regulator [Promicromonospora thailandica]|uniref:DNA-binding transcriptional regulator, MarR family n=1 Tax=Promicromonospora thailandica TaxID=765201 RepID=A0A9X2G761_9MICO|nr:MarR family transcriptional regulator [Promicromonospora thailandica]MCP2264489.1 DNA-binding transcriptional regulator, MarR family [Promicromonospora thailandica]BFF20450.1 MarR family transcriptional regulator [Promicromonospora thailandica]